MAPQILPEEMGETGRQITTSTTVIFNPVKYKQFDAYVLFAKIEDDWRK